MDRERLLGQIHKILRCIPYLGIILSIAVLLLLLFFGGSQKLLICASILLVPLIVISLFFIWKRETIDNDIGTLENSGIFCLNLNPVSGLKIYGILLACITTWLLLNGTRDFVFLFIIIVMYAVSIIQIFSKQINAKSILLQITITSLISVLTRQFSYYYYYNTGDSIVHSNIVSSYVLFGGRPPVELTSGYNDYFYFHINTAITSLLSAVDSLHATYITAAIPIVLSVVFVFWLAYSTTKSERIALLSSVCYLFIPVVFDYAVRSAPRTLATLAFLTLLCLFFNPKKWDFKTSAFMAALCSLSMILTHHAQLPIFLIIMTFILIVYLFYIKKMSKNQIVITLLFYLTSISYYIYTYLASILGIIERNFLGSLDTISITEKAEFVTETISPYTLFLVITGAIMLCLILFGIYYLIYFHNNKMSICVLMPIGLLLFALFIPGVAEASAFLSALEQVSRFQIVVSPIFAVLMGVGCLIFAKLLQNHNKNGCKLSAIATIILLVLFSMTSVVFVSSADSPGFVGTEFQKYPDWLNYDDYLLFDTINDYAPLGSSVYAEAVASRFFASGGEYTIIDKKEINIQESMMPLFQSDYKTEDTSCYILFRESIFYNYGLKVDVSGKLVTKTDDADAIFRKNTWNMYYIYDNGKSNIIKS